ncbi:MAG: hypothetical protein HRT50_16795 [Colwellia sp.]|uniref:hypothetical protein n=1 Tax=Colwellia sp. TaxID=56799 RepID=UPI001E03C90A|nr:hypothetical protein [Colwellia sp.]NQY50722.1 hypothetical protein [Colwellia sp.]
MNTIPELDSTEIEKELQELMNETRALVAKAKAANEADAIKKEVVKVKRVGLHLTFHEQKDLIPSIVRTLTTGKIKGIHHVNQNK